MMWKRIHMVGCIVDSCFLSRSLQDNTLVGTILDLSHSMRLQKILLQRNKLSGTLPALPSSVQVLAAHSNELEGDLSTQLKHMTDLQVLSLYNNSFRGSLHLPDAAPSLSKLIVHDNYLSCAVHYNSSSYNFSEASDVLLAPGKEIFPTRMNHSFAVAPKLERKSQKKNLPSKSD